MARHRKTTHGEGHVTHRSRGRFTLLSPHNLVSETTREVLRERAIAKAAKRARRSP